MSKGRSESTARSPAQIARAKARVEKKKGDAAYDEQDFALAVKSYKDASKLDPNYSADLWTMLGYSIFLSKDGVNSLEEVRASLSRVAFGGARGRASLLGQGGAPRSPDLSAHSRSAALPPARCPRPP